MKAITAIPISFVEKPDKMVWFHTKDGHFTARSAYHLQHVISLSSQGTTSNDRNDKSLCQSIWKLELPNRSKLFLWRACKEIIPTLQNLVKRKILVNAICPICLQNTEIVANVLWELRQLGMSGAKVLEKFKK